MSRGNTKNLKNLKDRPVEERREIAKKAGIQSGESRRKKKSMREWAKVLGEEEIVNSNGDKLERVGVIILQQMNAAMKGDLKAAKFIAELLGESGLNVNLNTADNNKITIEVTNNSEQTEEDLKKL